MIYGLNMDYGYLRIFMDLWYLGLWTWKTKPSIFGIRLYPSLWKHILWQRAKVNSIHHQVQYFQEESPVPSNTMITVYTLNELCFLVELEGPLCLPIITFRSQRLRKPGRTANSFPLSRDVQFPLCWYPLVKFGHVEKGQIDQTLIQFEPYGCVWKWGIRFPIPWVIIIFLIFCHEDIPLGWIIIIH